MRMTTAALGHPPLPPLWFLFVLLRNRKVGPFGIFIICIAVLINSKRAYGEKSQSYKVTT